MRQKGCCLRAIGCTSSGVHWAHITGCCCVHFLWWLQPLNLPLQLSFLPLSQSFLPLLFVFSLFLSYNFVDHLVDSVCLSSCQYFATLLPFLHHLHNFLSLGCLKVRLFVAGFPLYLSLSFITHCLDTSSPSSLSLSFSLSHPPTPG